MMPTKFLTMLTMAAIALVGLASGVHAQSGDGDIDVEELSRERLPYFGLGAGYERMLTFVDYDEMNKVSRELGLGDFSGPLSMDLGGLMFTPGIMPNLRMGIFVGTGTTQLSRQIRLQDTTTYTRTIYYGTLVVSSSVDYAIVVSNAFTIFPGIMLGGGRNTIGASQTRNNGTRFGDVFSGSIFQGDSAENQTNLNRFARALSYHVFIYPQVNFEYTLTPNIMIRLGAGYNTSVRITPWADEAGVEMADSPGIGSNGITVQGGVFVGLFQH